VRTAATPAITPNRAAPTVLKNSGKMSSSQKADGKIFRPFC
jgi:hypothetical protein